MARPEHPPEPKVRPLDPPGRPGPGRSPAPVVVGVLLALTLGAVVALGSRSDDEPAARSRPVAEYRIGLQTDTALNAIGLLSKAVNPVGAEETEGIPWRATLASRKLGDVFYMAEEGTIDLDAVPGEVFALVLVHNQDIAGAALPIALTPIRQAAPAGGYDLVFAGRIAGETDWTDVPLPGCGEAYPAAALDSDAVLHVWCTEIDAFRVIVQFPGSEAPIQDTPTASLGNRPQASLILDAAGTLWMVDLGDDTATVTPTGTLGLEPGQSVPGIAALSRDGRILYVGVAEPADVTAGRKRAGTVVAYDRARDRTLWSTTTPTPFESLVVAEDDLLYAYYSGAVGAGPHPDSALMMISPNIGSVSTLISPLDLGPGELVVLP